MEWEAQRIKRQKDNEVEIEEFREQSLKKIKEVKEDGIRHMEDQKSIEKYRCFCLNGGVNLFKILCFLCSEREVYILK